MSSDSEAPNDDRMSIGFSRWDVLHLRALFLKVQLNMLLVRITHKPTNPYRMRLEEKLKSCAAVVSSLRAADIAARRAGKAVKFSTQLERATRSSHRSG